MTNNLPHPDDWYDEYIEASVKQQYQMLLDIMQQPLSSDFLEETEMAELLITMSDELYTNNLKEEALTLINLVKEQKPKFYKKEFSFYDKFLVEYYLYVKQDDLVEEALARFKKYPGNDIEQLFVVLDLLVFYNKPEMAVDLCKTTYRSVKNNSQLIDGAEDELAWVMITDLMEKAYQQQQQGLELNWKKFTDELKQYNYGDDHEWLEDVKFTLTNEFDLDLFNNKLKQKKQRFRAFYHLSTAFYIYIKQEKQMSFICSQEIWEAIFEFLGSRELTSNQQANPHRFFAFDKSEIEPYLAKKINGFFSLQQAKGYAALWGIPYLYDFLLANNIIREQLHSKIITITDQLKTELIEAHKEHWELWRYDFINRWQPHNNLSSSELTQQTQFFTNSFERSEPLSDRPGEGRVESFFEEMKERLGGDFDAIREKLALSDEKEQPEISEATETTPVKRKSKSKKKKSNLGLAAKLYQK